MIFKKKKRKPSMLKERTDLYRLKLYATKPSVKSKYFLLRKYNIDDYVRIKFLLGEPL